MTMGYVQTSWTDIYIERVDGNIVYRYASNPEIMSHRDQRMKQKLPAPSGFENQLFDWKRYWIPHTPKGYSCLYTAPMYHTDLPFFTLPGVVDSDVYSGAGLHSPGFFIKKGFEGLIPAGTPLYQIIPFKREDWEKEIVFEEYQDLVINTRLRSQTKFFDNYKKLFWRKKKYV